MIRHIVYRFQQFIGTVMNSCTLLKNESPKITTFGKKIKVNYIYVHVAKNIQI